MKLSYKHKANTTELHPKVRQTCWDCVLLWSGQAYIRLCQAQNRFMEAQVENRQLMSQNVQTCANSQKNCAQYKNVKT